jgi:hypothetical protein
MRLACVGAVILAMAAAPVFAQQGAMAVAVGGKAGVPACAARGIAQGAVDVHVGPGEAYEVYDHLSPGEAVFVCENARSWYGIVYGKADCGVDKPSADLIPYMGACKTGWVSTKALTAASE